MIPCKDQPKLKPCPFCGGKAELCYHDHLCMPIEYRVYCSKCKIHTQGNLGKPDTEVKAWNKRSKEVK